MLRTHTTKNPNAERRIWAYPDAYFTVMRDAFRLRYALIPYLYTQARRTYETGVSLLHPMYYEYPGSEEAYTYTGQYFFGDDMVVAPIVTPVDTTDQLAKKELWIPPGEWIEWQTGAVLTGPRVTSRSYALDEVPVFVKAGSIVPLQPDMMYTSEKPVDPLILTVFPGKAGKTSVYEDQGNTVAYRNGEGTWLPVSMEKNSDGEIRVSIGPREGSFPGMLAERSYELRFLNQMSPARVEVGGRPVDLTADEAKPGWRYDGERVTVIVRTPRMAAGEDLEIVFTPDKMTKGGSKEKIDGVPGALRRLRKAMDLLNNQWPREAAYGDLVAAVQTGNRMSARPAQVRAELDALRKRVDVTLRQLPTMNLYGDVRTRAELLLKQGQALLGP